MLSQTPNIQTAHFPVHSNKFLSVLEQPQRFLHGVQRTSDLIANITGQKVKYFRPPPAILSEFVAISASISISKTTSATAASNIVPPAISPHNQFLSTALMQNYSIILSSLDSNDRLLDSSQATQLVENVLKKAKPGDIIQCHDAQTVLLTALPPLINGLKQLGYELITLTQMFSFPDDSPK